MPISELYQKISIVEASLKDAGTDQALNAVIDVLKDIAKRLEQCDKSPVVGSSSEPPQVRMVPEIRGRKFRKD